MQTTDTATKTLGTSLKILRLAAFSATPVTARELGQALDIPRSTLYRFLKTLVQYGFLIQTRHGYIVGPYVSQVSPSPAEDWLQSHACRTQLAAIAEDIQETVVLTVIRWPHAYALTAVEGPQSVRWSFTAGSRHPLYAGASAKALLAFLSDDALEDYRRVTPLLPLASASVTSWPKLLAQIQDIRAQRYCISDSEVDEGVTALAVPVFYHQQILASISVVGPAFRFTPADHVLTLQRHAQEVERQLAAWS
jgi:DNA-binding IclR family transcriptional regulator